MLKVYMMIYKKIQRRGRYSLDDLDNKEWIYNRYCKEIGVNCGFIEKI